MDIFEIYFIPGKGISTKSIQDLVVSCHFEVPANFEPKKFINKVVELQIINHDKPEEGFALNANLSSEGNSYYFSAAHQNYCIKLDISLNDSLMLGYIVSNKFQKNIALPTKTE